MPSLHSGPGRTVLALLVAGLVVAAVLAVGSASMGADVGSSPDAAAGSAPPDAAVAGQEETPTPTPTPEPPGRVTLDDSVYEVTSGETLQLNLTFEEIDEAQFSIGDETTDYRVNATVIDADGDGEATLLFDTASTGSEDPPLEAEGDDEVQIEDEQPLDEPANVTTLPVSITVEGVETGSATILVRQEVQRGETPTPTATPTPTETATPLATPTPQVLDGDTPDEDEGLPGFGILAAVLALLAAAAIRRLRN